MDLGSEPGCGLVVTPDPFTSAHQVPIISAAARNNVPAVYGNPATRSGAAWPVWVIKRLADRLRHAAVFRP
jgi:hypothetical protein